jgi:hypothetical protein
VQSVVAGEDELVAQLLVEALDHGLGRLPQDLGQGGAALAGGVVLPSDDRDLIHGIDQIVQHPLYVLVGGVELAVDVLVVGHLVAGLIEVPAQAEGLGGGGGILCVAVEIALSEHLI